jgi:hypothetical protein
MADINATTSAPNWEYQMKQLLTLVPIGMAIIVSGCAPEIVTATEDAIAVDVSGSGLTASDYFRKGTEVANAHCGKYGKKASLERTSGALGVPQVLHFSCK